MHKCVNNTFNGSIQSSSVYILDIPCIYVYSMYSMDFPIHICSGCSFYGHLQYVVFPWTFTVRMNFSVNAGDTRSSSPWILVAREIFSEHCTACVQDYLCRGAQFARSWRKISLTNCTEHCKYKYSKWECILALCYVQFSIICSTQFFFNCTDPEENVTKYWFRSNNMKVLLLFMEKKKEKTLFASKLFARRKS